MRKVLPHSWQSRAGGFAGGLRSSTHFGRLLGAAGLLTLAGCSGITDSLRFNERMLVKVPDRRIIEGDRKSDNGWNFRHITEAPHDKASAGNWYVAWQDSDVAARRRELLPLLASRWECARRLAPSLAAGSRQALGSYPSLIEPSLVFDNPAKAMTSKGDSRLEHPIAGLDRARTSGDLFVRNGQSISWPAAPGGALALDWHLRSDHSQLDAARPRGHFGEGIRIGICDNGMTASHAGAPRFIEHSTLGDAYDYVLGTPRENLADPANFGGPHGTATSGLLAGGPVTIWKDNNPRTRREKPLFDGTIGGAPAATIVPVRIAPWVFSIDTASMAYGLDYASRAQRCDVISLSHGGSPSQVWVDAVNAAYDRGTAIFAAEGDFISLAFNPLPPSPIIVPSSPVYPAAFRRVVGVTGVTEAHTSYARNGLLRLLINPFNIASWFARGSFGPDGWRAHFSNEAMADEAQRKFGLLHAYPIAGCSPNVPWLVAPTDKDPSTNKVDLNGSGTSASTPQVAAAAALWLNAHRNDKHIDPQGRTHSLRDDWHTWRKAEAVYFALLDSAVRRDPRQPDRFLGAGELKAAGALDRSYQQVSEIRNELLRFPSGYGVGRDYFDGTRSFWALLHGLGNSVPPRYARAGLQQSDGMIADHEKAFNRLYYNMLLLEKWHNGATPARKEESAMKAQGAAAAKKYASNP